jgi:hypothetical protein
VADGVIQAPADNTGKAADADTFTRDTSTIYRIRVASPDGMEVRGDLLELLLLEMQFTNDLIAQAFGLGVELENLRVLSYGD